MPSSDNDQDNSGRNDLMVKILYFTSLAGASILFGFSRSLSKIRQSEVATNSAEAKLHEEAVTLARRALFRGTIYAVCGFGAISIVSYQLFGRKLIKQCNEQNEQRRQKGPSPEELALLEKYASP